MWPGEADMVASRRQRRRQPGLNGPCCGCYALQLQRCKFPGIGTHPGMSANGSEQYILLNLVEFTQSSGALGLPCYMTDRGARPSLWRRPGLVLHTTGDVTPVTIIYQQCCGLARLKSCSTPRAQPQSCSPAHRVAASVSRHSRRCCPALPAELAENLHRCTAAWRAHR